MGIHQVLMADGPYQAGPDITSTGGEKIESQEDIAQLRANVALDKADKDRNTKKRGDK